MRQTPVFLGRKKRSADDSSHDSESADLIGPYDQEVTESVTNAPRDVIPSTTETIEFTFNGQREKYIVAQTVSVEVYAAEDALLDTGPVINDVEGGQEGNATLPNTTDTNHS